MKILAIDTSAKTASAALCDALRPLAVYTQNVGLTQSEAMLPMIENLLKDAKTDIDDIDMFACTVGPGSFTGVRIGVSLIKGLAFGKNKICVGVSTLEALAHNIDIDGAVVAPVMDARQNRIYGAFFKVESGVPRRLTNDDVYDAAEFAKIADKTYGGAYFVGNGYDIVSKFAESGIKTPKLLVETTAYSVAAAAYEKYVAASEDEKAKFCDALLFPTYLRPSQAERNLSNQG